LDVSDANAFPHGFYLAAALIPAAGGLALTSGVISADAEELHRLTDVFAEAFRVGLLALVYYAIGLHLREL
jgi:hypothetical protein